MKVLDKELNLKAIVSLVCILLTCALPLTAQEGISVAASPSISIPMSESADLYKMGYGGGIEVGVPISSTPFTMLGQFNFQNMQLQAEAGNLQLIFGGGGLQYSIIRNETFSIGPQIGAGMYLGFFQDNQSVANPYYSAGIKGALHLGKGFTISVNPEYRNLVTRQNGTLATFYSGMDVALRFSLNPTQLSSGTRRPQLRILEPNYRQVFPVIYKYYDQNPIGNVVIRNGEKRTIHDVKVEFFVPRYMDGPQLVAEIKEVRSGAEMEIPITALFNTSVMEITEQDTAQSQITISYTVANHSLSASRNQALRIYDRNSINWDDDRKAAAFITAKDPTILKFSRNITSEVGTEQSGVFNSAISDAVALFEALKEYGLEYKIDPDSSYEVLSQDESRTDYLQFPVQTLDYRSGDCDDLTILYSSLLEAVSVETAFVTTPGHIYLAFSLGMSEAEALRLFRSPDDLIIRDGTAWLPVEVTLLNEGFVRAWEVGAKQWREASENGNGGFFPVRAAWSEYAPTWFGSGENDNVIDRIPAATAVVKNFSTSMDRFIEIQITPMVERLETGIAQRSSPRLINQLGTLFARYGLLAKAEEQFRKAAREDYLPSVVNLGNVYYLDKDYATALRHYERAYEINPDNTDVLISLARTNYAVEKYTTARDYYEVAQLLDPGRADEYAYISGTSSNVGRASDIAARSEPLWSEE